MDRGTTSMCERVLAVWVALVVSAAPALARADEPWMLSLEGAAAVPVTAPQSSWFGPGASLAATVLGSLSSAIAIGARARGVFLSDGAAPEDPTLVDPGVGGLFSLGLGARLRFDPMQDESPRRATGAWIDAFGAAVLTGSVLRPGLEVGLGYGFEVGDVSVGPSFRWLTVFETDSQLESRHANILLLGIEIVLFDARPTPALPVEAPAIVQELEEVAAIEDAIERPEEDTDGDSIPDSRDACPNEREVVNGIDDEDGCPDEGLIELVGDRVVLDERVLFAFERARVRRAARPILQAIVELQRQHPEWTELAIEGHADVRGPRAFNQELSERRAAQVRAVLVELGIPEHLLRSTGHGERAPRAWGDDEAVHQRNRRVEFVVVRREARSSGGPVR